MRLALACLAIPVLPALGTTGESARPADQSWRTLTLASGKVLALRLQREATEIGIISGGAAAGKSRIFASLERDRDVAPNPALLDFHLVGEIGTGALILTESYPSLPGGLSYCRAGQERFLRVLAVAARRITETLRLKLESCRQNIELATDGLDWKPDTRTLIIHWLSAPEHPQQPQTREYRIETSGAAELVSEREP